MLAAQRHVMLRGEFDRVMADSRVFKYVVRDPARDRLAGLGTMSDQLDSVPLISPEFFARRHPEAVAGSHFWYVSFVAVHPDYHGPGTFGMLIGGMCREVSPAGG